MPISNRIAHYFFRCSLRLGICPPLCWRWFNWPILLDHRAAPRRSCVETTERADVHQALAIVTKHTIPNILVSADSASFMVMGTTLHGRTHVVDDFCTRDGAVHCGRISQIA